MPIVEPFGFDGLWSCVFQARERPITDSILRALGMAFAMGWEILWPLFLGFALSAVVQAVVSHREMARLLPDDRPRSIATETCVSVTGAQTAYAKLQTGEPAVGTATTASPK